MLKTLENNAVQNCKKMISNEMHIHTKIGFTEVDLYNYWKTSARKTCCDEHKEQCVVE